MIKNQLEILEVKKYSLCPHIYSINFTLIVECLILTQHKLLDYTSSKTRGTGLGTSQKIVSDDLLFHLFPTFAPLTHGLKSISLNKIHI